MRKLSPYQYIALSILFTQLHSYGSEALRNQEDLVPHKSWYPIELLAGSYFQNASVTGEGTTPRSTYLYLLNELKKNSGFLLNTIEDEDFRYRYFYRFNKNEVTDVVLLPFEHKLSGYHFDYTLDKFCKETEKLSGKSVCDITKAMIKTISDTFTTNVNINMLTTQSSPKGQKLPEMTRFGRAVHYFFPMDPNISHLNFMQVKIKGKHSTTVLFEPGSFKVGSRYLKDVQGYKASKYDDASIRYVYRGDQCYNKHDCGRFSLIYLMYALEGKNVQELTNVDIYRGFKRWIESPQGLLSYQKEMPKFFVCRSGEAACQQKVSIFDHYKAHVMLTQEDQTDTIPSLLQESRDVINNMTSSDWQHNSVTSLFQNVERTARIGILKAQIEEYTKMVDDFFEEANELADEDIKKAPVKAFLAIAQQEAEAPVMKKTKMAQITSIWRFVVGKILG